MARSKLVLFAMPYGLKYLGDDRVDFEMIWLDLLKPSAPQGWDPKRMDKINEPGSVAEQVRHYLRIADVVVFDLTTCNPNVLYELGVREVFAPGRRVLVAREGTNLPFNIGTERVIWYPPMLDSALKKEIAKQIGEQILQAAGTPVVASQVAPSESRLRAQLDRATTLPALVAVWEHWTNLSSLPVDTLLLLAKAFSEYRRLDLAVAVARRAYEEEPHQFDVARTLGWYLRKTGELEEAGRLLQQALALNPRDVESMGMLGGMYKRRALDSSPEDAEQWFRMSKDTYAKAVEVDPKNIYNLVNVGALTFITDKQGNNPGYRDVIQIVESDIKGSQTWDLLALGEAYLVSGRADKAEAAYTVAASRTDFNSDMRDSATQQLALLENFGLPKHHLMAIRPLLDRERARPGRSIILIHVSDVHFGKQSESGPEVHRFGPKGPLSSDKSLAEYIVDEVQRQALDDARLFVVISGDIGYRAVKEEYAEAGAFVSHLREKLMLKPHQIVIVPGNHDVNWKLAGHDSSQRFDEFLRFLRKTLEIDQRKELYPFLPETFDFFEKAPEAHKIVSFHSSGEDGIVFVGFNTCVVEDDKRHFGAIGNKQIELVRKQLADVDPSWLRIAVMHHHVLPLESQLSTGDDGTAMDGTIVHDFALVERHLHDLGFDMVLHGHKHEPGIRVSKLVNACGPDGGKSLIICGAGSAGAQQDAVPRGTGNHFGIYKIHPGRRRHGTPFVDIEWRELPFNGFTTEWKTTGNWKLEG